MKQQMEERGTNISDATPGGNYVENEGGMLATCNLHAGKALDEKTV
jgi:hypothetical protein